jgi:secondary thiamine-phosphate synthase enzyme
MPGSHVRIGAAYMQNERWIQKEVSLQSHPRGIHLVTADIVAQLPELGSIAVGVAHLSLLHTSAGLTLNENFEPEVRRDMNRFLDKVAPEGPGLYEHAYEGSDDMPAHIKSILVGTSVTIPIRKGAFRLGPWQGVYLCEFRNRGGTRRIVATLHGADSLE